MIPFLLLLICITVWKLNYIGKEAFFEKPLDLANVVPLKGICAIEIVLGHAAGSAPSGELLYINNRIGVWVVGIFFFLSGYGLMKSLHQKKDYLNRFLQLRLWGIFAPFVIVYILKAALGFHPNFLTEFISDWFVCEIIIIYILWYILYRATSERNAFLIMSFLALNLNIFGCIGQIGSRWYGSTACFLVGILFEKYEANIYSYIKERYSKFLIMISALFLFLSGVFIFISDKRYMAAVLINITCFLLCCIIYMILMKIQIGNKFLIFCGKISWGIYLTHRIMLRICCSLTGANAFVWMMMLLGGTIGLATIVTVISNFLVSRKIDVFCARNGSKSA